MIIINGQTLSFFHSTRGLKHFDNTFFGGKYILINHVLQSIPIYILSTMSPPKRLLNKFTNSLLNSFGGIIQKWHVNIWIYVLSKVRRGLGFKSFFDISNALFAKLWWRFRTQTSFRSTFYGTSIVKKTPYDNGAWQRCISAMEKIIRVREDVEHEIWWYRRKGMLVSGWTIGQHKMLFII